MARVPPVQRAAEDLRAQVPDAVAHFRLCGGEGCLWLPSEADVTGGRKSPNMPCKNTQTEGTLRAFRAPIANVFDHKVVFTPTHK